MTDGTLFCLKHLEKKILDLNGSAPSREQAYEIMVLGFSCFMEFARGVNSRMDILDKRSLDRTTWRFWFIDRVLPAIVIAIIFGVVGWITLVNSQLVP